MELNMRVWYTQTSSKEYWYSFHSTGLVDPGILPAVHDQFETIFPASVFRRATGHTQRQSPVAQS